MNDSGNGKHRERPMKSISNSEEKEECGLCGREPELAKKILKEDRKEVNTTNCVKFRIIRVDQDQKQCTINKAAYKQEKVLTEDFLEAPQTIEEEDKVNIKNQEKDSVGKEEVKEEGIKSEGMIEVAERKGIEEQENIEVKMAELNNINENDMHEDISKVEACKSLECITDTYEPLIKPVKRKRPASKRNGHKQLPDKKPFIEDDIDAKEKALILQYMSEHNRPCSMQNIFDGLKGQVRRLTIHKILKSLVEEGQLVSKDFNKLMVYMINPKTMPTIPKEEIERLNSEMAEYHNKLNNTLNQIKQSQQRKSITKI